MGLDLNLLVPLDALLQECSVTRAAQRLGLSQRALADQLAASAPLAAAGILDAILQGGETALDQGLEFETQAFALAFSTEDMREGTTAFLEKRKAEFKGR